MKYTAYEKTGDLIYPEKLTIKTFWGNTYTFLKTKYDWHIYSDQGIIRVSFGQRYYVWTDNLNDLLEKARFDHRNNILPQPTQKTSNTIEYEK